MNLGNMLVVEAGLAGLQAAGREGAIAQMVGALAQQRGVDQAAVQRAVEQREQLGSTLIVHGEGYVAIPHAIAPGCRQLMVAVATSRPGIPWGVEPGQRANLVFLVVGPAETHALYLLALSRIARLCDTAGFVEALLAAATPADLARAVAGAEEGLEPFAAAEGMPTFCVLGAGNGGMAMAGHLALLGCRVNLFNRGEPRLEAIRGRGGLDVTGEVEGFATLNLMTTEPGEAVRGAEVLMVVVPATAHRDIARMIAPHVKDGQIVILNPGRTGGALEVARILRELNPAAHPFVAEAQTLLYASRVTNPGQVRIFAIKNSVPLASLPAYQTPDILPVIRRALPQFVPGDNVLKTSFDNIGAVFHPAITLLNAGRIEDTHGDFEFYHAGVTPAVARILEGIDQERVAVAAALGIRANTAREWLYLAYDAAGRTLLEAIQANKGYGGIKAPNTALHRYITEDVPCSLVPIASIGEMLGVPTPNMRAIIQLASEMHDADYWRLGRTVEQLGIQGLSVQEIRFLVVGADLPRREAPAPLPADTMGEEP
ncbi:MAG: NAD/NADP octopine/nopaline dehydrogenase family protein [Lentisphaeria bacterium]|jgi:opine dehydrogenase